MLFVLLDFSSADVKLVAAHTPVVNSSRPDIACDGAAARGAPIPVLGWGHRNAASVFDTKHFPASMAMIHFSRFQRALHRRLTVRAYVLVCLAAWLMSIVWQFSMLCNWLVPGMFWPWALTLDFREDFCDNAFMLALLYFGVRGGQAGHGFRCRATWELWLLAFLAY